jgi:TRAP-type C4-dicarboxylate transport system permease small subunit
LSRLRACLDRGFAVVLPLVLCAAVLNVTWQVVSRYALGAPSSGTDELARVLLVWIGMLGAAAAVGRGSHLAVDLLPARLETSLGWVAHAAVLGFSLAVLVAGGGRLVWLAFRLGQTTAALGLPMGLVYLAVPTAGLAMAAYALASLLEGRPRSRG